ncbi:MAG: hypothetical protein JSU94_02655 [Phycisphaerales bacterium]|nr:MAG: hypothetical protein JSU94_02655 [Phycisphaerales bacterium]
MNARLYYYDLLSAQTSPGIPRSVAEHVEECQFCQEEMARLEAAVAGAGARLDCDLSNRNSAITAVLKMHFAYADKSVTCNIVRPFLPSIAVADFEISIPTPITVHLENCRACGQDLLTLKSLGLSRKQLYRLGRLFAEKPSEDIVSCTYAQAAVRQVGSVFLNATSAEVLKHLCICPDCRKMVYTSWAALRESLIHTGSVRNDFPCDQVLPAHVFDYCFPYGIDPANDQYAKFRESLASHLRSCPVCMAKVQRLHDLVCSIIQRPESGVVTSYRIKSPAEQPQPASASDIYGQWPIDVQVVDSAELSEPAAKPFAVGPKRAARPMLSVLAWKQFVKPLAAAAVVLIGILLLLNGPAARAVDLAEIYEALAKVGSVCVSEFLTGQPEPNCKYWMARRHGLAIEDNGQKIKLYDLTNDSVTTANLDGPTVEPMSPAERNGILDSQDRLFGLLQVSKISGIPEDARWVRVTRQTGAPVSPGIEVYDLIYTQGDRNVRYVKWRAFVDPRTKRVSRTELYSKYDPAEEYRLYKYWIADYVTEEQVQNRVRSSFGSSLSLIAPAR